MRAMLRPPGGPAYDHSGLEPGEREQFQAGNASIWRYADFLPFAERPPALAHPAGARPDAAGPGRAAGGGTRAGRRWSRTTPPTRPIRSRTVSSASPWRRRASWALRRSAVPRPETWPTQSPRTRPRRASTPTFRSCSTWRSRKLPRPVSTARSWSASRQRDQVTGCAPSCASRPWAFVTSTSARITGGLEDRGLLGGRSSWGGAFVDRTACPIALGLLVHGVGRAFRSVKRCERSPPPPPPPPPPEKKKKNKQR